MKEEILKKLNLHEIKKSKVEKDLSMPQNSLSAMLSGKKEIPSKWVQPLTEYIKKLDNPIPPMSEPYERVAYLQKQAQNEPKTEKVVESTQIPIEACTMHDKKHKGDSIVGFSETKPMIYEKPSEKVILASIVDGIFGHIAKLEIEQPFVEPNQTFDQLLKQFNNLIESSPKVSDIKLKLEQIKESAKNSNLTPRQTDAIVDRCNHFLNNNYNQSKHNLKLS